METMGWGRLPAALAAGCVAMSLVSGADAGAATDRAFDGAGPAGTVVQDRARGLTLADLTALEAFGRAAVSPDGRWAVYERRGAYEDLPRFDLGWRSTWAGMVLWRLDLTEVRPRPVRLMAEAAPGQLLLSWSPSGRRLLVARFQPASPGTPGAALRYEYGVVDPATGAAVWTGITPGIPRVGAQAAWLSDDVLLLRMADADVPPALQAAGFEGRRRAAAGLDRTAAGRTPSRQVMEARDGRLLDVGEGGQAADEPSGDGLVRLELSTGRTRTLAGGGVSDFEPSPDGRFVAVVLDGGPAPLSPEAVVQLEPDRRGRLAVLTPDGQVVAGLGSHLDVAPHLLRWSPASGEVLVWARPDGAAWREGGLYRLGPAGADAVDMGGATPGGDAEIVAGVRADWIGDRPVLLSRPPDGGRPDWRMATETGSPRVLTAALAAPPVRLAAVTDRAALLLSDGAAWVLTADGVRRLTDAASGLSLVVTGEAADPRRLRNDAPRRDWASVQDRSGGVGRVDLAGQVRMFGAARGEGTRVLAGAEATALVLDRAGLSETLRLARAAGEDGVGVGVGADVVNAARAGVRLIRPVAVDHPGIDGRPTRSWLYLPDGGQGKDEGAVRGVIVKVYPGGTDGLVWADPFTLTYATRPQVFAAAGYAVLSAAVPGDLAPGTRGDQYVRAIDLAVDAALAAHPRLPADRLAVMGHSFGGYAALETAVRSRRFRSYVISSGYADMFGAWGEFDPAGREDLGADGLFRAAQGWVEAGQGRLGAPPWRDPQAYVASSPWLKADRITAPVLLLTGDRDFTPMSQAERLFGALLRTGGRVRLVAYRGEGHNQWSPANIRDRLQQILDWLDDTLGPDGGETDQEGVIPGDVIPDAGDPPRSAARPPGPPAP